MMMFKNATLILWVGGFLCSLFFINAWQLELFGAAIILLCLTSVLTLMDMTKQGFKVEKSYFIYALLAFWFLIFISIFRSDIFNISLMAFCFLSAFPLSFFVLTLDEKKEGFARAFKFLGVVFAGLSIWALIQFFILPHEFGGRAHHPLMNPNSLAALFSLGFFMALGGVLSAKDNCAKGALIILSILVFGGMVATGSRGAFFAMLPFLMLFVMLTRKEMKENLFSILMVAAGCVGFLGLSYLGLHGADNLAARVTQSISGQEADILSNRLALWQAAFDMIKDHGIFGTGVGTYFLYFPEYRLSGDLKGAYYAHSDPLQFWVELGVLGPILFYTLCAAFIGRTVNAVRHAKGAERIAILASFSALGACLFHTHVTFNFYNLSLLFMMGFLTAFWFVMTQRNITPIYKNFAFSAKTSRPVQLMVIILPFILLGGLFSAYILSEHYTNKARSHLLAGELEYFAEDVMTSNAISMQGNYRSYLLAVNVPLTLLENPSNNFSATQREEIFNQAYGYLTHVVAINPRSASAHYYLGLLRQLEPAFATLKNMEADEFYYRRGLALDPLHIGARMALSDIYERRGEAEKSLKTLEAGADYKYNSAKAMDLYGALIKKYLENGNSAARDKVILKMQKFQGKLGRQKGKRESSEM